MGRKGTQLQLNNNTKLKFKKNEEKKKEQIKAPEKIQPSNEEIANLSDAQFKTLVIRKLTDCLLYTSDAADDC